MKGKIILAPIEHPKEGMKVILETQSYGFCEGIVSKTVDEENFYIIYKTSTCWRGLSELQQLFVEYDENDRNPNIPEHGFDIQTLPLHPGDWEKGLELIGKEVNFFQTKGFPDVQLVDNTSSPVLYTEEEVKRIAEEAFSSYRTAQEFDEFWNKNKKK